MKKKREQDSSATRGFFLWLWSIVPQWLKLCFVRWFHHRTKGTELREDDDSGGVT